VPDTDAAADLDALVDRWSPLPDVSAAIGVDVTRVRQMLRDRQLVALRRDGVLVVPADLVDGDHVVKGLGGLLTLLADAGYDDVEMVRWIFTVDDSLPGRPVDALRENRGTEVRRRAQALGF
jgi:hypothetical protein